MISLRTDNFTLTPCSDIRLPNFEFLMLGTVKVKCSEVFRKVLCSLKAKVSQVSRVLKCYHVCSDIRPHYANKQTYRMLRASVVPQNISSTSSIVCNGRGGRTCLRSSALSALIVPIEQGGMTLAEESLAFLKFSTSQASLYPPRKRAC
jgi:hypothetical protein